LGVTTLKPEAAQSLLKGHYTLTWFDIAQNLAIEPVRVIQTFELSKNYDDFLIQIKRLKDPDEKRGKSKFPNSVEAKAMDVEKPHQSEVASTKITVAVSPEKVDVKDAEKTIIFAPEIIPEESIMVKYDEPYEAVDPDELAKQYEAYSKELETLKAENERLKKEISDRDQQINSLPSIQSAKVDRAPQ
jgi:hypothetical protein